VTTETVLGGLCSYVLLGLLFAFLYLAVSDLRDGPFFTQPGPHAESEYVSFSFVALTTLGFGDLPPSVGLPQALTALEALVGRLVTCGRVRARAGSDAHVGTRAREDR
jgi:hypothetical protein